MRVFVEYDFFARFCIEESDLPRFVTSQDKVWSVRKSAYNSLRADRIEHEDRLFRFYRR